MGLRAEGPHGHNARCPEPALPANVTPRTFDRLAAACLRIVCVCGFVATLGLVSGCDRPRVTRIEGFAQGTTYHLTWWSTRSLDIQTIRSDVAAEFNRLDEVLSNYRPDSAVEKFNATRSTEPQAVPPELVALFETALPVHEASRGCYDLTIKPAFKLWGFQGEALTHPTPTQLERVRQTLGMDKIEVTDVTRLRKHIPEVTIDVSSIAQGYSVERIAEILETRGVQHYLVEIGGEIRARGHKPDGSHWRIAIERPLPGEQQRVQTIIELRTDTPLAVMTSGTYRHFFDDQGRRYSHILDARTASPVAHDLVSVTVIHTDPALADAWSTALLCLGPDAGLATANAHGIPALLIEQTPLGLRERRSDAFSSPNWKVVGVN